MDTQSNRTHPDKSWDALLARARKAAPPAGIDVRFALRRALEAEIAAGSAQTRPSLWHELADLGGQTWLRWLLGGSAVAAIPLFSLAIQGGHELLEILRLAPLMPGF